MKMQPIKMTTGLGALALAAACGGAADFSVTASDLSGGPLPGAGAALDRPAAAARAVTLLGGGDVLEVERETERGLPVWEVKVRRPSGVVVEVDLYEATGDVVELEGEGHVAGDDLAVAPGFLTLAEALDRATRAVPGEVTEWELELDYGLRWTWDVEIRTASAEEREVEVDARTGEVELDDVHDPWDDDD